MPRLPSKLENRDGFFALSGSAEQPPELGPPITYERPLREHLSGELAVTGGDMVGLVLLGATLIALGYALIRRHV